MTDRVVEAGTIYQVAAQAGRLDAIESIEATDEERELLSQVYDRRMVAKAGSGRDAYDELRSSLPICPYCNQGEVYELDHFLPKTFFPDLNVLPINLIPICHPCNHIKLEALPEGPADYFLHPYFDPLPANVRWLFAELKMENGGPALVYRVELEELEHGDLARRLKYHFRRLQLDRRFKAMSASVLAELEAEIDAYLEHLDPQQMAAHFTHLAERSFDTHGNTFETAAYYAAAESEEYCTGGYRN